MDASVEARTAPTEVDQVNSASRTITSPRPLSTTAAVRQIQPAWRAPLIPAVAGIMLLGALFHQEVATAIQTWNDSTAYNHCYLVIPITLYLLWDRRFDFAGLHACPSPAAALLGLPVALSWLAAERLGVMEGRQLAAVSFLQLLLLAVLGLRLWRAMAGPLLYLYFLVPFGAFLTPKLQDITTWFIGQGVDILGIPAYIDGYVIEIPQGAFFVAEACAGLRFLIASIAFGCLYALVMYRDPLRRGLFILASAIVPIVANGIRGIGIVVLGYMLNNTQAAAADHLIYGWVFFSFVTLLLIMLGLPFRQDNAPAYPSALVKTLIRQAETSSSSRHGLLAAALIVVAMAAVSPAIATALVVTTTVPRITPSVIDLGPGCTTTPSTRPASASSSVHTQRAVCDGVAMDMTWETFSPGITAAPLMAARARLTQRAVAEDLSELWLTPSEGGPGTWRVMRSGNPAYAIAVSVWVDGQPVRPGLAMRVRMAISSLFGSAHTPIVMTVTPAVDWSRLDGQSRQKIHAGLTTFLLSHPDLIRTVGALSSLQSPGPDPHFFR
jgi:exosortase A